MARPVIPLITRFWASVHKTDGCWFWTGSIQHGYGYIGGDSDPAVRNSHKRLRAHRLSWELHFGGIPAGLVVCHKCDVAHCVNPEHLFLGSTQDNVDDKVRKGRQARGDTLPHTKLRERDCTGIRRGYWAYGLTQADLAIVYEVSQATISRVILIKGARNMSERNYDKDAKAQTGRVK